MNTNKLTFHNALLIGSLIFGMLFGAGNLIFPVHLGQMAGAHWLSAAGGFLMSGVLLPLMALLAISITRSNGIYDLARPNGAWYALIFLILVHATLGPLFATDGNRFICDWYCAASFGQCQHLGNLDLFSSLLWPDVLLLNSGRTNH